MTLPTTPSTTNPRTVSFAVPGTYTIKLTVWDATGQVSFVYTKTVRVLPANITGVTFLAIQSPGTADVTLTAIPQGGDGAGVTYQYTASYIDVLTGLPVPVTISAVPTTVNPITVSLTTPGKYTIELSAWDATKQFHFIYRRSIIINPTNITNVNILSVQASGGSPYVTLTAVPIGGDGADALFLFTVSLHDILNGTETPLAFQKEKSADNPVVFTAPSPGYYTFGVTAWDASGQMQFVARPRTICVTSPSLTSQVALIIADYRKRSPQVSGTEIPLQVYFPNATDTKVGLRYWYQVKNITNGITTDLTTANYQQASYNWTPNTSGDYLLSVTVTDPTSGYKVTASRSFQITAK